MKPKRSTKTRPTTWEPAYGEYHSESWRKQWCKDMGHPLVLLNPSKSRRYGREIKRCVCGEKETA